MFGGDGVIKRISLRSFSSHPKSKLKCRPGIKVIAGPREGDIGWFGIPGGPEWRSTKTHAMVNGKPLCGSRLGENMEFQWCSTIEGNHLPECKRCEKALWKG